MTNLAHEPLDLLDDDLARQILDDLHRPVHEDGSLHAHLRDTWGVAPSVILRRLWYCTVSFVCKIHRLQPDSTWSCSLGSTWGCSLGAWGCSLGAWGVLPGKSRRLGGSYLDLLDDLDLTN